MMISRSEWGAKYGQGSAAPGALKLVVIHHTAGPTVAPDAGEERERQVVRQIEEQHGAPKPAGNGWAGIGYNWLVFQSGRVYEGRGWRRAGAHTPGMNATSAGIAFVMDAEKEDPTPEAIQAVRVVMAMGIMGNHLAEGFEVKGHSDFTATKCPGAKLYPRLGELRALELETTPTKEQVIREALEEIRRQVARIEATL